MACGRGEIKVSAGTAGEMAVQGRKGAGREQPGCLQGRRAALRRGWGRDHQPPCAAGAPLPSILPERLPVTAIAAVRRRS